MKRIPLYFLLIFAMNARSQEKGSLYVFDADWKPTKIKTAHFLLHTHQLNDTCWQWDYYNFVGPLIKTEQYRDKDGNEINGVSYHYNEDGYVDSMVTFIGGKRNGEAYKRSGEQLRHEIKYVFRNDTLIETVDHIRDTVKKNSSKAYDDEKESEFPGGIRAWYRYLSKNLKYPDRAVNGNIQGQVIVRFEVDLAGNVINPFIYGSVEYSLDEEAIRVIKNSGKWVPSFQNGHNVKAYKSQPLNFKFQ
jgi:periplasmic protein TonB